MILNERTASHPFYQPGRRARIRKQFTRKVARRYPPGLATGDCPGHREGRSLWMKARQAWKREEKRLRRIPNAVRI